MDNSGAVPSRRFLDRLRRRGSRRRGAKSTLEIGPELEERDAQRLSAVITRVLDRHDTTTVRADLAAAEKESVSFMLTPLVLEIVAEKV